MMHNEGNKKTFSTQRKTSPHKNNSCILQTVFIINAPAPKIIVLQKKSFSITQIQPLILPMHEVFNQNLQQVPYTLGILLLITKKLKFD